MASIASRATGLWVSSASRNTERPSEERRDHGVCLFGPRVRFPHDSTDRSYVKVLTMTIHRMQRLAAINCRQLAFVMRDFLRTADVGDRGHARFVTEC